MPEHGSERKIIIKGARVNNLKNINLSIPRDKLIVITGLSGSGKSSLAFDTIYAEGQRRYVESLSAYARQFLGRIHKPEVDFIKGLPPAIAVEQRVRSQNPRSTVGTTTEIYDYLKLLFARIGKTYSPKSGKIVKKHTVTDVVNHILTFPEGAKLLLLTRYKLLEEGNGDIFDSLRKQGFMRIYYQGEIIRIDEISSSERKRLQHGKFEVVVDRIIVGYDEDSVSRFADSVQIAFEIGSGDCYLVDADKSQAPLEHFTIRYEADGMKFEEPNIHMFSFNSPVGACGICEGYGSTIGIDENLVVPNKGLSVYQDAVVCWKGEKMQRWKEKLLYNAGKFDFPVHKPYAELTAEQRKILWEGNRWFKGLNAFFAYLEEKKYKIQYRVMLSRYRGRTVCPECHGSRLKKETSWVKIAGKSIQELVLVPIDELSTFFKKIKLNEHDSEVAARILLEINNRLEYLMEVGLGYLTLNRISSTLSGGETQRINLATSLGSSLVGSMYILDEPSIGLHSRDTDRLILVLKKLRDLGNTVIVVEHDEEIIRSADYIIDIGPLAGSLGGKLVFNGPLAKLLTSKESLTANYLTGKELIEVPKLRRKWNSFIELRGVRENNLNGFNVKIPLHILTVVSGVSGSGKSSLVSDVFYPVISKMLNGFINKIGLHDDVTGDIQSVKSVEMVDQDPIGKSSRSNPVTYIKAYDEIRKLFADQPTAGHFNFTASHFSFNVDGGRCEECQGEGIIRVEMQFMADVQLVCESCHGKRFKDEILEITYQGLNIHDVLELTIEEAVEFFGRQKGNSQTRIVEKLQTLVSVGLGYLKLGQSSSTLSGGESQRVKLASFLGRESNQGHTLFIFDEPTTGLHFHDIHKLLDSINALVERGHTVLIIEHNLEVIKSADWVIDLGPEGGKGGGSLVFEGKPEELAKCKSSYTGRYLQSKLKQVKN
jgi:excinuclease ABC subunit A